MGTNFNKKNLAYGLGNPLQGLSPEPIVSDRSPSVNDVASVGQIWINKSTNAFWILTSVVAGSASWAAQDSSGSQSVADLTVTGGSGTVLTVSAGGDTALGGDLAVLGNSFMDGNLTVDGAVTANGDFDLTSAEAITFISTANEAPSITLGVDGGTTETILISATQGTSAGSVTVSSTEGGITITTVNSTSNSSIELNAQAGGYQFDAALASTINVTGAGQDLTLNATGGSVLITGTESAPGAVSLTASGAAGTVAVSGTGGVSIAGTNNAVSIQSGTAAVNINTAATAGSVVIGNNTGGTTVSVQAGTGGAGAINVGTTANDVPVTIGNSTGASGIVLNAGTAGVLIGTNAIAHPVTIGNTTGATAVTILSPAASGVTISNGTQAPGIFVGTGSPNGSLVAAQGSIYLNVAGSGVADRMFVNSDGNDAWVAFSTVS